MYNVYGMDTTEAYEAMLIQPVPMGFCTSYLIRDEGIVLVDAGQQGHGARFQAMLKKLGLSPSQLTLIFLSHGHWDHIGALSELRQVIKCPVAINEREKEWVEKGLKPLPPPITAWGRILEVFIKALLMPKETFGGASVDISIGDEPFSLEPYGVRGKAYRTPGHSPGSMSIILEGGQAFVGDLAVNGAPQRVGPNMPVFAEDPEAVKRSWRMLLEKGANTIYPAHGKPFAAAELERLLRQGATR